MGHITNPVGFRVGRLTNWSSFWSSDKFAYANSWILDLSFQRYFEYLFKKLQILSYKQGFLFSHVDVYFRSKVYFITVYLYNANVMLLHKGRFFYYWKRFINRGGKKFKKRLMRTCRKINIIKDPRFFSFKLRRTSLQYKLIQKNYLYFQKYIKKNAYFKIQRLFKFFSKYRLGIFLRSTLAERIYKGRLVHKSYFFFKTDARKSRVKVIKNNKSRKN